RRTAGLCCRPAVDVEVPTSRRPARNQPAPRASRPGRQALADLRRRHSQFLRPGVSPAHGRLARALYLRVVRGHQDRDLSPILLADDSYIRESILQPGAKIVAGYEDIMPNYRGQLNEEDILKLIAFIRALGRGQTPTRVEDSPAPLTTPPIKTPTEQP